MSFYYDFNLENFAIKKPIVSLFDEMPYSAYLSQMSSLSEWLLLSLFISRSVMWLLEYLFVSEFNECPGSKNWRRDNWWWSNPSTGLPLCPRCGVYETNEKWNKYWLSNASYIITIITLCIRFPYYNEFDYKC